MPPSPIYSDDVQFLVPPGAQSKLVNVVDIPNPGVEQVIAVRFEYFDVFLEREDRAGFVVPSQQLTVPTEAPEGYIRHT